MYMTRQQQILWAVIIVIVIVGGYWWWSSLQATPSTPVDNSQTSAPMIPATSTTSSTGTSAPMSATITFNGDAFSPANVTIAQGGTVTWTSTGGDMWVASDPHPLHNGYDGTTREQHCAAGYAGAAPFDQCSAGTSFTFTFSQVGTWGYHDHLDDDIGGTVTVVAQ